MATRVGALRVPALLLLVLGRSPGVCEETPEAAPAPPPPLPELDLDKLYPAPKASFTRIANRLLARARAKRTGADLSRARFELFQADWVRGHEGPEGVSEPGRWAYTRRGNAQVVGNGLVHTPQVVDIPETIKELTVSTATGQPRTITFRFRVQASDEKPGQDPKKAAVLGKEEMELQIIQHPGDKSVRVVLDPLTFRKHQASLSSNWVKEEEEEEETDSKKKKAGSAKKPAKKGDEGAEEKGEAVAKEARPVDPREEAARSEVTIITGFKADENDMVVRFRRKWEGFEDKVVDGALHIDMDSTLSTALFYEIPGKSGKLQRFRAAYFQKGHKIE